MKNDPLPLSELKNRINQIKLEESTRSLSARQTRDEDRESNPLFGFVGIIILLAGAVLGVVLVLAVLQFGG